MSTKYVYKEWRGFRFYKISLRDKNNFLRRMVEGIWKEKMFGDNFEIYHNISSMLLGKN